MQDLPAHVSPLIHDKPIEESLHSDRGEEYVNKHTAQDDEQSATKQLVKQNAFSSILPTKHQAPDARPTTTAADISSTSISPPLHVSSAQGTSYVDVIENLLWPLTWFTDYYSPLPNGTPSNSTLYTTPKGMY